MTSRIVVPPASAVAESLAVAALALVVLAGSATTVWLRREVGATTALPAWQIDGRTDLSAAEQGLNADLRVAAEEILAIGGHPGPEALAAEALPPFATDATMQARGGHVWSLSEAGRLAAWVGRPAAPEPAGAMLLRLDGDAATVWWQADPAAALPGLSDEALIGAGWRMVVTRFDASVTRSGLQ